MKRISAIILALSFLFLFSVCSYAYTFDVMIDDRASLFSEEETERVDEAAYEFANSTEFSVAVVTTEDAMGKSAMEFADDYYDSLIFSSGWSENGILFLIDMDNREIYVSCAGLCIDEYSDYELNKIVDSGYFYVTEGEYADCIITMISEAEKLFAESNDISSYYENGELIPTYGGEYEDEYYYSDYDYTYDVNEFSIMHVLIYIVIGLVAGGITVFAVKSSYKNIGKGDEFNADDISLELTASNDNVISKNVITTKIPKNNNNNHHRHGGGGGGGRVSVHRSSGGVRHSGAGRKF
ncbi:MAG: TPM domain-containing protein [Clostridia bacterium]|nr:TPM domain-containing protein [Clostridia bacterium]